MGITLSKESKSAVSLSNEVKNVMDKTWDEATETWNAIEGTWDYPGSTMTKESKSAVSLSLESK